MHLTFSLAAVMTGIESIREAFIASYNFSLALPAPLTQPGDHLIAKLGTYRGINNRGNTILTVSNSAMHI